MFCGSCMHDNALAKALRRGGDDVILQPIYTPIRTDELDIAQSDVFFGGIHVYLLQQWPWLRRWPRWSRSWMDRPALIRWATRRAVQTDPAKLGDLTISMLRGTNGRQSEEVQRLVDWLANEIQPDAIVLTNLLIGGAIPAIKQQCPDTKIIVVLQGDDIFLDHLPDDARATAIELCGELAGSVDRFVTNSRFYQQKMGALFGIDAARMDIHPLSIEFPDRDLIRRSSKDPNGDFRIGFFARIAPEKGLHVLAEAFEQIAHRPGNQSMTLHAAGWLGAHNEAYLHAIGQRMADAGLADRFTYHGSPDRDEKYRFLASCDVLSVPSPYQDPKGLFVLESLAAGTPVVQPDHGAFGELIGQTGGGLLFPPGDFVELGECLQQLHDDAERRDALMADVPERLTENHSIEMAADRMRQSIAHEHLPNPT